MAGVGKTISPVSYLPVTRYVLQPLPLVLVAGVSKMVDRAEYLAVLPRQVHLPPVLLQIPLQAQPMADLYAAVLQ